MSESTERGMHSWLAARRPPPPPTLAAALRERFADGTESGDRADALADAALESLAALAAERATRGSKALAAQGATAAGELAELRARAHRLLEADALLTYALEAAAEQSPERLERLAARLSPAAFAGLLPDLDPS